MNAKRKIPDSITKIPKLMRVPDIALSSGIYFLVRHGKLTYIGQSIAVLQRIGTHAMNTAHIFDSAYWIPVPRSELDAVETFFIVALKPPENYVYYRSGLRRLRAPNYSYRIPP
jgi:hypothetical protein